MALASGSVSVRIAAAMKRIAARVEATAAPQNSR
jgi:hypothetical protein